MNDNEFVMEEPMETPEAKTLGWRLFKSKAAKKMWRQLRTATLLSLFIGVATFALLFWARRSLLLHTRAGHGEAAAQYWLAKATFNKAQTLEEYKQGISWLRQSAEQGYAPAQLSLGLAYAKGLGVRRDQDKAIEWLSRAGISVGRNENKSLLALLPMAPLLKLLPAHEDFWARDLARKNLAVAAAARRRPQPVTTTQGEQFGSARIYRITPEAVLFEVQDPPPLGCAQIKREALSEEMARLCDYSREEGVLPFSVWQNKNNGASSIRFETGNRG